MNYNTVIKYTIILALVLFLMHMITIVAEEKSKTKKITTFIRSYGDDRFDDCDELLDIKYQVQDADTIEVSQKLRPCNYLTL